MKEGKYIYHEPVMLDETLEFLNINRLAHLQGTQVVDATLGFAGHTLAILKKGINVVGFEADPETAKMAVGIINTARPASKNFGSFQLINSNFRNLKTSLTEIGVTKVNAVLFDFGVSSFQLTSKKRGFSFLHTHSHLDMRLDPNNQVVHAGMLLNALNKAQLTQLFSKVVEYRTTKKLVELILRARIHRPIVTVGDILELINKLPKKGSFKINPATKIFMALRMAVNSEIESITEALPQAFEVLKPGARLVVITFHSAEDIIVKTYFKNLEVQGVARLLTKKPVIPSKGEILKNARSRSAKLRCLEKI